ncbi:hypothetical protein [uncultured Amphritea sp.]|uniref:hypothetical protein n=1 Tax=uncultured Amphritea sp. TaxID=981605 RepID=UPI0025D106F2|nr:hypothetical protein [uncultured Amphritea sp.]
MSNIDIQISGTWPASQSFITTALVNNIANSFIEMAGQTTFPKLLVVNEPSRDCPMANFEKVGDRTIIFLCSNSGGLWSKIAYQLSHELCHVHANFAEQRGHTFKWLEESFCELSSFCNMLKMSRDWEQQAPLPFMQSYYPSLNEYVQNMLERITKPEQFTDWLNSNFESLKADSCIREKNSIIALQLMPLFIKDNKAWKAVGYINNWAVSAEDTLSDYVNAWETVCPEDLKQTVKEIGSILGVQ